jgi:hypothetical protein
LEMKPATWRKLQFSFIALFPFNQWWVFISTKMGSVTNPFLNNQNKSNMWKWILFTMWIRCTYRFDMRRKHETISESATTNTGWYNPCLAMEIRK